MRPTQLLSTKQLSAAQAALLLNAGFELVTYDAIAIEALDFEAPEAIENAIFTSQNGVNSFLKGKSPSNRVKNCFCVGEKTAALLTENRQKIAKTAENASELAHFIVKNHKNSPFFYFCGNRRRDELPNILKTAKIDLFEVKTYKTKLKSEYFDQKWPGILFFSPSGIESYLLQNTMGEAIAFCIGETTASEARKHTDKVMIADQTSVESVIDKAIKVLIGRDMASY